MKQLTLNSIFNKRQTSDNELQINGTQRKRRRSEADSGSLCRKEENTESKLCQMPSLYSCQSTLPFTLMRIAQPKCTALRPALYYRWSSEQYLRDIPLKIYSKNVINNSVQNVFGNTSIQTEILPAERESIDLPRQAPVLDIEFDHCEDFAVIVQKCALSLLSTSEWDSNAVVSCGDASQQQQQSRSQHSPSPMLVIDFNQVRARSRIGENLSYGFSSVQFMASSLNVVCGYNRLPIVDVFDLEDVDEVTCEPLHQYNFRRLSERGSSASLSSTVRETPPHANVVAALTENITIAALSNGMTALLDTRISIPSVCTGLAMRKYSMGDSTARRHAATNSPLTALALRTNDSIICGTKSGTVTLWDLRNTKVPVCDYESETEVGSIIPTFSCGSGRVGSPCIWFNNFAGDIKALSVVGDRFQVVAQMQTNDAVRSDTSACLSAPKMSLREMDGLLFCPHISSNSVRIWDTRTFNPRPQCAELVSSSDEQSDISSSEEDEDEYSGGKPPSSSPANRHITTSATHTSSGFSSALSIFQRGQQHNQYEACIPATQKDVSTDSLKLLSVLPFRNTCSQISACVSLSHRSALAVGTIYGSLGVLHETEES